jgi:hypothetical protein
LRARWGARLAAWLCLLALSVHQLVPPALAASWSAGDATFICHAGAPADTPADNPVQSDDEFGCCGHCPLCQSARADIVVPPDEPRIAPPPVTIAAIDWPLPRLPAHEELRPRLPLQPRAPPVMG